MLMRFSGAPDADQCALVWSTAQNKKAAVGILSGKPVEIAQWVLEQMDAYASRNTIADSQLKGERRFTLSMSRQADSTDTMIRVFVNPKMAITQYEAASIAYVVMCVGRAVGFPIKHVTVSPSEFVYCSKPSQVGHPELPWMSAVPLRPV